jgi:hypothetical protein
LLLEAAPRLRRVIAMNDLAARLSGGRLLCWRISTSADVNSQAMRCQRLAARCLAWEIQNRGEPLTAKRGGTLLATQIWLTLIENFDLARQPSK